MKVKFGALLIVILLSVNLLGCQDVPAKESVDDTKDVVADYIIECEKLSVLEDDFFKSYNLAIKAGGDKEISEALERDTLVVANRWIDAADDINPGELNLRSIHELYINGTRAYKYGILYIIDAGNKGDMDAMIKGSKEFDQAKQYMNQYWEEFLALAEESSEAK